MSISQFDKDPGVDRALRHSVRDGMAYSVAAGGGETYFSAFALFLKATAPQVALLTTLPPLIGSLAQFVSAWGGRAIGCRAMILIGATAQGLLWLPILALPLIFPQHAVILLLVLLTLFHSAANLAAPQWTSLMRDLVADRRRGRYFGHRTRLTTLTSFVALVVCGLILHGFDTAQRTAIGFCAIFLIAFLARMLSVYHVGFLHEPANAKRGPDMKIGQWWDHLRSTGAVSFSVYFVLMNMAVAIASPFFTVYMLRDLQFSYLQFMANTGMSVVVQFLTLGTWGRIADIYGNRLILIVSSMSIPFVAGLWILSNDFWYLLLAQCVAGLSWGGFSLSSANILFELLPRTQRVAYLAFHNVITAAAVFAGAMFGALFATALPVATAFFGDSSLTSNLLYVFGLSALARMTIAVLGVRTVPQLRQPRRSLSPHALVLRVTGFNAFVGLVYELIGSGKRDPTPAALKSGDTEARSSSSRED